MLKANKRSPNGSKKKPTKQLRSIRLKHAEHTTAHRYIPHGMRVLYSPIEVAMYKQCVCTSIYFFSVLFCSVLLCSIKPEQAFEVNLWMSEHTIETIAIHQNLLFNYDVILLSVRLNVRCTAFHFTRLNSASCYANASLCVMVTQYKCQTSKYITDKWSAGFFVPFHLHNTQSASVVLLLL